MTTASTTRMIYALIDPRDHKVRYVGYTKNFFTRMQYHFQQRPERKSLCGTFDWLRELADLGMMPISTCLERLEPSASWQERERFWIKSYREAGEPLLNGTEGGYDGGWGWHRMTPERRAARIEKMRQRMKEITSRVTHQERIERGHKGGLSKVAKHGPGGEHLIGNKLRLGIPTSDLQKYVASQANKDRWANYSPERRAEVISNMRLAQSNKGPMSEETKAKDRAAHRSKWDSFTPEQMKARLAIWHAKRRARGA